MSTLPLTDAEQVVTAVLRQSPDVSALVADRVYSAMPQQPSFPLVLARRVGGAPVIWRPLVLDAALVQIDAYGGGRRLAWTLAEAVRRALSAELPGVHPEGVVSDVKLGSSRNLPDSAFTPAKPRYLLDATVYLRPLVADARTHQEVP